MEKSKQQLADCVMGLICASSGMVDLWQGLGELAARYGQSPRIFNCWLDGLLEKVAREYDIPKEGRCDLSVMRQLALDPAERVAQMAMEILLEQRQEAVDEIVAILRGERSGADDGSQALRVKKLYRDARLPQRVTEGSTGLDLFAYIKESGWIVLQEKPRLVGTGIAVEVPRGYDVQIRPRSGLSAKGVVTAFGTVDSDYRGEIMVTMYTLGRDSSFEVRHGDRIAQLIVGKLADLPVEEAEELSWTERGPRGHGSSGIG